LLGLVAGGKDPTRVTHGEGFGVVMERYVALREPAMKPRSFTGTARHLRQHAKPLHRLALADIDRRGLSPRGWADYVDRITARSTALTLVRR